MAYLMPRNHFKDTKLIILYWPYMGHIDNWSKNYFSHQELKKKPRGAHKTPKNRPKNCFNRIFGITQSIFGFQGALKAHNQWFTQIISSGTSVFVKFLFSTFKITNKVKHVENSEGKNVLMVLLFTWLMWGPETTLKILN